MMLVFLIIGSLCVWRFPDRDMKEIFDADAYQTVFVSMSEQQQDEIEKRLGDELDPDETEFKFYPVTKNDEHIGTVSTHLGKGQYGAIEVVVGLVENPESGVASIKAVRIQRDREKAHNALHSSTFLNQFIDLTVENDFIVGEDIQAAEEGAEKSSAAVAFAVKKILIVYEVLMKEE